MPIVALEYIEVDDRGVAKLIGHRIKVTHLVMAQREGGYTTEQLMTAFPHLDPAQVHAALAYYYANKAAVDRQIEEGIRYAAEMRAKHPNQFTREELVARWQEKVPDRPVPTADEPDRS